MGMSIERAIPGAPRRSIAARLTGSSARQSPEGEIFARSNLRNFLFPKGRVEDAARETTRVAELGRATNDPLLKARAWTLEATQIQDSGGDLGPAYRLLKHTEAAIFPDGPYRLKRTTLNSLGLVAFRLGRLDEALTSSIARYAAAKRRRAPRAGQRAVEHPQHLDAKENDSAVGGRPRPDHAARRARPGYGNRGAESRRHSEDPSRHRRAPDAGQGASVSALEHVDSCLELAREDAQPGDEAVCSWVKASILAASRRPRKRAAESEALDAARRAQQPAD